MKEPISNVYNCDCVEHMRQVPDKFYDLAVVDCPYGDARPDDRGGAVEQVRATLRPLQAADYPPLQAGRPKSRNRFNGSRFKRYREQTTHGGRFERYATYKTAHERREDAEILPFLDRNIVDENA